jgi:hypothetical protein
VQSYACMVLRSPLGFGTDRILYNMSLSVTDPLAMPEGWGLSAAEDSGAVIIGVTPRKSIPMRIIPVWSPRLGILLGRGVVILGPVLVGANGSIGPRSGPILVCLWGLVMKLRSHFKRTK